MSCPQNLTGLSRFFASKFDPRVPPFPINIEVGEGRNDGDGIIKRSKLRCHSYLGDFGLIGSNLSSYIGIDLMAV